MCASKQIVTAVFHTLASNPLKERNAMTNTNELMDQNILEYESRQKHAQELVIRARELVGRRPQDDATRTQIELLTQQHDHLSRQLNQMQDKNIRDAGPMAVWDILAGDLEKLVEKLTHD